MKPYWVEVVPDSLEAMAKSTFSYNLLLNLTNFVAELIFSSFFSTNLDLNEFKFNEVDIEFGLSNFILFVWL